MLMNEIKKQVQRRISCSKGDKEQLVSESLFVFSVCLFVLVLAECWHHCWLQCRQL